jgi:hypothetical protein
MKSNNEGCDTVPRRNFCNKKEVQSESDHKSQHRANIIQFNCFQAGLIDHR